MAITSGIIAAVGVAASLATTGYALSQGSPDLPPPPKPTQAPLPKPPTPLPPPPTPTDAGAGISAERRKAVRRYGVADTLLVSPLGSGGDSPGKRLLGG